MEQTITELTQVLRVTIEDLDRLAQHINTAFANVDSGFNTLAETVYSTIPEAIAQASATQQAKVNRLARELADLQAKMESFHAFHPRRKPKSGMRFEKPDPERARTRVSQLWKSSQTPEFLS